jgi:hypothetical protein
VSEEEQIRRLKAGAVERAFERQQARVRRLHDAVFDLLDHDGEQFTSAVLLNIGTLIALPPPGAWHERPVIIPLKQDKGTAA